MLSCTACGKESENPNTGAVQGEPEQAVSTESNHESEPEETNISTEKTTDTESMTAEMESFSDAENSDYEDAVRAYYTYLSERDLEGILHLTYPDAYAEILQLSAKSQGHSLTEILNSFEDNSSGQIRLESINEAEPLGTDECTEIGESLGKFRYQLEYFQTHGIESLLSGNISEMDETDLPKYAYHIPEAYIVTCSVVMETESGEERDEQIVLAYYIEDEGWKTEASMIGYVRKSKQAAVNSYAKMIYNAAATVSVDLDIEGRTLPVSAVISSDSSREYGIDAAFSAEFKENMRYYFDTVQDYDYFIIIKNGFIDSVICRDDENADFIGRSPVPISSDNKLSFEELYKECLSELD